MPPSPATHTPGPTAALWAGLGYLAIFVLAVFANFFVVNTVFDLRDPQATLNGIAESETLLRLGILAFLIVFLVDVVIAWGLFVLFRPVHRDLSLLAAWSRLTYTLFLGVGLVFAFRALTLVGEGTERPGLADSVQLEMRSFDVTWIVGLAAFGLHLIVVGRLLHASDGTPRWLGIALTVAGAAYMGDTALHILLPDYASYADLFVVFVAVPSVIGELGLTVWLLRVAAGRRSLPTPEITVPQTASASNAVVGS